MTRAWAGTAALLIGGCGLLLGGCGLLDSPAERALSRTGEALAEVRSGTLDLTLTIGGQDEPGSDTGFALRGPFALDGGPLPVLDMEYTRIVGSRDATVTLRSTGDQAFVEVDGTTYELGEQEVATLRREGGEPVLAGLDLGAWVVDPQLAEEEGGTTVSGAVDLVALLGDLFGLAGGLGGEGLAAPSGAEAERLAGAVTASSIEVVAREDGQLERLDAVVDLGSTQALGEAGFPDLRGARLTLSMALSGAGEPVEVDAPADARPFTELPGG